MVTQRSAKPRCAGSIPAHASLKVSLQKPGWRNGRRVRLKIECRKTCGFKSRPGHKKTTAPYFRDRRRENGSYCFRRNRFRRLNSEMVSVNCPRFGLWGSDKTTRRPTCRNSGQHPHSLLHNFRSNLPFILTSFLKDQTSSEQYHILFQTQLCYYPPIQKDRP